MKEQIYKICTQLNDGQIAVTQATEQLLDLLVVMQRSEQLVCEHKPIDFDVVTDTVVVCKCGYRWHR